MSESHAAVQRLQGSLPPASAPASASVEKRKEEIRGKQAHLHREIRALEWQQMVRRRRRAGLPQCAIVSEKRSDTRLRTQVALHGGWKSAAVSQLVLYISQLLLQVQARKPNVWSHVPEMFVECAVCSFHALQRTQAAPLLPTADTMALLLTELLNDGKLVSPYMHDVVLQSVANMLGNRACLGVMQRNAGVVDRLVPRLLRLYDQEHWLPLTPVLLRLVGRDGVAPPPPPGAPPCALTTRIVQLCLQRSPSAASFVNQLFSALDWAATEVTVGLRDLASGSRPAESFSLRRRLAVLFSLAVSACDLLDYLLATAPTVFLAGPPSLAARLAEMLAFLVVHAPVDPAARGYQHLADVLATVGRGRVCHPLALAAHVTTMLGSCWAFERGPPSAYAARVAAARALAGAAVAPDAPTNSVVALLVDMDAACPTAALEALARAPFSQAAIAEAELAALRAHVTHVADFAAECKLRRAGARVTEAACPPEFLDPIMMMPMVDPVRLPESGVVVDRVTIERHLLSSATDPYSRTPLAMRQVVADEELRARIEAWRAGGSREASSGSQGSRAISSHAPQGWDLDSETSDQ